MQQLRHALARHRQRRRGQTLHAAPAHDVRGAAPAKPPRDAHRDPRHHPVTGSGLLQTQVCDDDVGVGELWQFGVLDPHLGVDDLSQHQHFAGPFLEPAQRDAVAVEGHRVGLDRRNLQDRYENPSARGHLDDESKDSGLLANNADADHDVAHAAE